jgi:predicted naringenin-chalcone synthase
MAHSGGSRELETRMLRLLGRVACTPDKIAKRGHSLDYVARHELPAERATTAVRMRQFESIVDEYFVRTYANELPPDDIVHVTCTGYVSPSGAQRIVAENRWPTRVTHAYHMGCYAAVPAIRIASSFGTKRVDVVHTELCSLHVDTSDHRAEQLVVQSLFADGLIRYSVTHDGPGFELLTTQERIVPDSSQSMSWRVGDYGMAMTLARDVPSKIASVLRDFVVEMYEGAGLSLADLKRSVWAVHPGGPKILDGVRDALELTEDQVAASRSVLRDYGNMSSATLPHIWMHLGRDLPEGTLVPSLAFGPGLSICGAIFEKRC